MTSVAGSEVSGRCANALLPPTSTAADAIATLVTGLRRAVAHARRDGVHGSAADATDKGAGSQLLSPLLLESASSKDIASWIMSELDECLYHHLEQGRYGRGEGCAPRDWCVSAVAKLSSSLWNALSTFQSDEELRCRCLHPTDTELLTYVAERVLNSTPPLVRGAPLPQRRCAPPLSGIAAHCLPPDALFSLARFWLQRGGGRRTSATVQVTNPPDASSPFTFLGKWLWIWLETRGTRPCSHGTASASPSSSLCAASLASALPPQMLRDFVQWTQARRGTALASSTGRSLTDPAGGLELTLASQSTNTVEEFRNLLRKVAVPPRQNAARHAVPHRPNSSTTGTTLSSRPQASRSTAGRGVGALVRGAAMRKKPPAKRRRRSPSCSSSSSAESSSDSSSEDDSSSSSESEKAKRSSSSSSDSDPIQEIVQRHKQLNRRAAKPISGKK